MKLLNTDDGGETVDGDDWPAYPWAMSTLVVAIVIVLIAFVLACIGAGAVYSYVSQFIH